MRKRKGFVAIDGESFSNDDSHDYVLLASSTDEYVYNPEGLSTVECFNYLNDLRVKTPDSIYVAFGLNYDVNMMLRDLGREALEHLWKYQKLQWRRWLIEWIPGKWFSVKKNKASKAIRIYDVFGFFQSSFLKALADWGIEAPKTMAGMKESRHSFDVSMLDRIVEYCQDECAKLVELMNALRSALESVSLTPASWVGAGAIASALMRKENVKAHHSHDTTDPKILDGILRAYFGGRVEVFQSGPFNSLTAYDVCSAYPSETLNLPSLTGDWVEGSNPKARQSISLVKWSVPKEARVMPFPVRMKGNIYYPSNGSGWYHSPEVRAALRAYPDYVEVLQTYEYVSDSSQPFAFVRDYYRERARLKAAGDPAQKVVKLGLNSLYGKLAQGVGYQGQLPPFQSFHWAGRVTSGTRARLFELARESPDEVVMIATDGIFFRDPAPDFPTGTELGSLEMTVYDDAFVAQPGVYTAVERGTGKVLSKSRGFFAREINWQDIRDGYRRDGAEYVSYYPSRRFLGLGSALSRTSLDQWRTWVDGTRALSLYPSRKFLSANPLDGQAVYHVPPSIPDGIVSERYTPKTSSESGDSASDRYNDTLDQPLS